MAPLFASSSSFLKVTLQTSFLSLSFALSIVVILDGSVKQLLARKRKNANGKSQINLYSGRWTPSIIRAKLLEKRHAIVGTRKVNLERRQWNHPIEKVTLAVLLGGSGGRVCFFGFVCTSIEMLGSILEMYVTKGFDACTQKTQERCISWWIQFSKQ